MYKNPQKPKLKAFFEEYGPYLLMVTLPIGFILCLLQFLLKTHSILLIIIASVISGFPLMITGLKALAYKELRNFTSFGMLILGAALIAWAGFLIFKPASEISTKTQMLFETRSKAVSADDVSISLDISPVTYQPGEKGQIVIKVENNSEYELVLDSVMFEAKKKFFDGFVVDYESAVPPIGERKEKLGVSIALFFGEDQIHILPGERIDCQVEIAANTPGDYSGDYYAILMVGMNSKAMPKKIPEVSKEIYIVIQPEE